MVTILDANGFYKGKRGSIPSPDENLIFTEVVYDGNFLIPRFDGEKFIESATSEELEAHKQKLYAELKSEYENRIDNLVHIEAQKKIMRASIGEAYEIPEDIKQQYVALRAEYNEKRDAILQPTSE